MPAIIRINVFFFRILLIIPSNILFLVFILIVYFFCIFSVNSLLNITFNIYSLFCNVNFSGRILIGMDISKELGMKIRYYRKEKEITQEKLAELCGFHPTYIGQLERGEKNASIETLYRVSRGLNISMCSLLDEIECSFDRQDELNVPLSIYHQLLSIPPRNQERVYKIIQEILELSMNCRT